SCLGEISSNNLNRRSQPLIRLFPAPIYRASSYEESFLLFVAWTICTPLLAKFQSFLLRVQKNSMAPKTVVDLSKSKGKKAAGSSHEPAALPTFSVVYPFVPLPQRGDLGADSTQVAAIHPYYSALESIPLFGERGPEEVDLLSEPSVSTFRRMITDVPLESINREPIVKPVLLVGDSSEDPDLLDIETYECLRTVNE
ncbi:uncharacterized protein A4U43_UnF9520, partial [Asparagus officinalis]